jgi:molybdopterin synthase sulfur carrier subunit
MIKVLFFAQLREQLGCDQLELPADAKTLAELREQLCQSQPAWCEPLSRPSVLMAVNQRLAKSSHPLADGDEVAFFPPVTGG